jgi:DNA-binding transcriptional MerR regulator
MNSMNMREVSASTSLSYAQIRYFIDQGVVNPKPVRKGQTREFSDLDLWLLHLAAAMRKKNIGIKYIKGFTKSAQSDFDRSEPFLMVSSGNAPGELPEHEMISAFWDGVSWDVRKGVDAFDNLMLQAAKLLNNEGVLTKTLKFEENKEDL